MGKIPEETINAVIAATDIVAVIGSYIQVKKAGSSFKACCPFHHEKTPSFNISPQKQAYYCFGCGAGGGAIQFVKSYENLSFTDAVKKLAAKAGIPIIEENLSPEANKERRLRSRLLKLHQEIAQFFHQLLLESPDAKHARSYLKERGFGSELAKEWKIGWVPEHSSLINEWAKKSGFTARELVASGLAALRDENQPQSGIYYRFRDRLMFPISNDFGDVIGFSGRILNQAQNTGKYINSPETLLFDKSKTIFALDRARREIMKRHFALVCEGQIDAIICSQNGLGNAVAPLGTAFTSSHARLLKRYTQEVVLCFDSDGAGRKAVDRAYRELVPLGIKVRAVKLPNGEDPDSLIRKEGAEHFQNRIQNAPDYFEFKFQLAFDENALKEPAQKSKFIAELAPALALLSDLVERDALIQRIAGQLDISDSFLRQLVLNSLRSNANTQPEPVDDSNSDAKIQATPLNGRVAILCQLALQSAAAQSYLFEQVEALHDAEPAVPEISLLMEILAFRPNPESPASVELFLESLPPADALALQGPIFQKPYAEPIREAQAILSHIGIESIRYQRDRIQTQLRQCADPFAQSQLIQAFELLQASLKELTVNNS